MTGLIHVIGPRPHLISAELAPPPHRSHGRTPLGPPAYINFLRAFPSSFLVYTHFPRRHGLICRTAGKSSKSVYPRALGRSGELPESLFTSEELELTSAAGHNTRRQRGRKDLAHEPICTFPALRFTVFPGLGEAVEGERM